MTEEQKKLLKAELCRRLNTGLRGLVSVEVFNGHYDTIDGSAEYDTIEIEVELLGINADSGEIQILNVDPKHPNYELSDTDFTFEDFVPCLRPMSSRTEKETKELQSLHDIITDENYGVGFAPVAWATIAQYAAYCDKRHFDWSGHLIGQNLAVVARDGLYSLR